MSLDIACLILSLIIVVPIVLINLYNLYDAAKLYINYRRREYLTERICRLIVIASEEHLFDGTEHDAEIVDLIGRLAPLPEYEDIGIIESARWCKESLVKTRVEKQSKVIYFDCAYLNKSNLITFLKCAVNPSESCEGCKFYQKEAPH